MEINVQYEWHCIAVYMYSVYTLDYNEPFSHLHKVPSLHVTQYNTLLSKKCKDDTQHRLQERSGNA